MPFLLDLVFGSLPEHRVGAGFSSSLQHCSAVASVQGFCHPSPPLASSRSENSLTRYQQLRNAAYCCCWFWSESLARGAELQSVCGRLDSGERTSSQLCLSWEWVEERKGLHGGMGQTLPGVWAPWRLEALGVCPHLCPAPLLFLLSFVLYVMQTRPCV